MDGVFDNAGISQVLKNAESYDALQRRSDRISINAFGNDLFSLTAYHGDAIISNATFSNLYDRGCLQEDFPVLFVRTDTGKGFALPEALRERRIFSDFKQVSGIWYPMYIRVENYIGPEPIDNLDLSKLKTRLSDQLEIKILSCEFNIPIDDVIFETLP